MASRSLFGTAALLPIALAGALLLFGAGLAYFVFIGARAIYRSASGTARGAGHDPGSAGQRAIVRMVVWAAFFGIFYGFLFFLGRRMGWWAVLPGIAGGVAMVLSLLQTDRLLTMRRDGRWRPQLRIGLIVVLVLAAMISVTWFAAVSD
jgi:hypothetical protein